MACFGLLLLVYTATAAPSLTWAHYGADGGDLVTAVVRGRLPHPPGFPVYLLLGRVALRLPWGDPAWRLNYLSAICAAAAAGLTSFVVRRLSRSSKGQSFVALCAGLSLGLAPLFWSQALITEVQAPAALLSALLLFLAVQGTPPSLLGFMWGVSMGVHPTLVWLAPLVVWGGARSAGWEGHRGPSKHTGIHLLVGSLAALGGWWVAYGLLLPRLAQEPSPWGGLTTLADWAAYVSGRLYHTYVFGLPLEFWPRRLLAEAALMVRQFTPVGVPLLIWGGEALWRQDRSLAFANGLTFAGFSLFAIGYNTADSLVYLVPALPVVAIWVGLGWQALFDTLDSGRSWWYVICLLLPLVQAGWNWRTVDLHRDYTAVSWLETTLRTAPRNATLVTTQDAATFALWYGRDVLKIRSDVRIVDRDLWTQAPYRAFLAAEWGVSSAFLQAEVPPDKLGSFILPVYAPAGAGP